MMSKARNREMEFLEYTPRIQYFHPCRDHVDPNIASIIYKITNDDLLPSFRLAYKMMKDVRRKFTSPTSEVEAFLSPIYMDGSPSTSDTPVVVLERPATTCSDHTICEPYQFPPLHFFRPTQFQFLLSLPYALYIWSDALKGPVLLSLFNANSDPSVDIPFWVEIWHQSIIEIQHHFRRYNFRYVIDAPPSITKPLFKLAFP
jgi:hypothetical protein